MQYTDQNTSEHIDSNGFDDVFICFFSHDTATPFDRFDPVAVVVGPIHSLGTG